MEMAALKTEGDTTVDTNPDERLGLAVLMLAKGTGSIQERLAEAFLQLHALRDKDFPTKTCVPISNKYTIR
jgi:hypothetical protein